MTATEIPTSPPSFKELLWAYSNRHRRLGVSAVGLVVIEILWFAFVGYEFRDVQPAGFLGYAPLTQCTGTGCATVFKAPPPIIGPVTDLLIYALPAIWALFFVAPSLARELESKSVRFSWTQAATRKQWLAVRIASGLLAALAVVVIEVFLVRRWVFPHNYTSDPWHWFLFTGVLAPAFALLLVSVAILSSLLWKKPVATLLTTAILFGVVALAITSTYPNLLSPNTVVSRPGSPLSLPQGSLVVDASSVTKNGVKLSSTYANQVLSICSQQAMGRFNGVQANRAGGTAGVSSPSTFNPSTYTSCLESHDLYSLISYQPPFRFWELQWIYAGATLGATAAIVALSFMLINRIDI
jgi:ABC-type transport system involved in multi-copper enzyme maturation permease subunit